jgi:UDP-glucose 4-epimerase
MNHTHAVTITGVSGFVGSNLARYFLERGDTRVFGADLCETGRMTDFRDDPNFSFEPYDVHQPLHSDLLAVDTLYHFAGIANPQRYLTEPLTVMNLNLDGLRNILERVDRWSAHKPRIVYSSTSEVYGKNTSIPFREDSSSLVFGPTQVPRWCYAMTKAVGEHYLQAYGKQGQPYTIFRFFNIVGPDIDSVGGGRVFTKMVGDAEKDNIIRVVNGGGQTRCFTWIGDAVEALVLPTTMKKSKPGFRGENHVLNLGSDEESTIAALAVMIAERMILSRDFISTVEIKDITAHEMYGAGYEDVERRVPDVQKIYDQLGWKATTTLAEMVGPIVDHIAGYDKELT